MLIDKKYLQEEARVERENIDYSVRITKEIAEAGTVESCTVLYCGSLACTRLPGGFGSMLTGFTTCSTR